MTSRQRARCASILAGWLFILGAFVTALGQDGKMVITTSSEEARRAYLEGLVFFDRTQPESARPLFEKAVELDPDFIMAYDGLAQVSPTFKGAADAFRKVEALAARVSMSAGERLYFDALFAARRGDRAGQLEKLEALAAMCPRDERVLYRLGLFYYGTDDEAAVEVFRKALAIDPSFVPVYNRMGYSLRALGRNAEAEAAFKKAIELDPESPNAYDSYAELLLKLGRFEESVASYDAALELEPLFPSAQIGVAANLILQGRHAVARRRLESLFDIAPHDGIRSGIHWALAVTHADEGNLELAITELLENFEISKRNDDRAAMEIDLRNIGAVLLEAGELDEAEKRFDAALEVIVNDPDQNDRRKAFSRAFHAYGTGVVAAKKGELDRARERAEEMDALVEPLSSRFMEMKAHELKAVIRLEQQEFDSALAELRQADATEVYNMYRMALAYEGLGNVARARSMAEYVVTYHSPLNFNYSFVRHKAAEKLAGYR